MQKIAADLTSSSQAKINQPWQSSLSQGHSDLVSEPLAVEVTLSAQNPFEASSNHSISMRLSLESGSFSFTPVQEQLELLELPTHTLRLSTSEWTNGCRGMVAFRFKASRALRSFTSVVSSATT